MEGGPASAVHCRTGVIVPAPVDLIGFLGGSDRDVYRFAQNRELLWTSEKRFSGGMLGKCKRTGRGITIELTSLRFLWLRSELPTAQDMSAILTYYPCN